MDIRGAKQELMTFFSYDLRKEGGRGHRSCPLDPSDIPFLRPLFMDTSFLCFFFIIFFIVSYGVSLLYSVSCLDVFLLLLSSLLSILHIVHYHYHYYPLLSFLSLFPPPSPSLFFISCASFTFFNAFFFFFISVIGSLFPSLLS